MRGYNRVHSSASCNDCGWSYSDILGHTHKKDTGRKSQEHANKTGHVVHVEIGFYKDYKPQKESEVE